MTDRPVPSALPEDRSTGAAPSSNFIAADGRKMPMRIHVVIPTTGRAGIVGQVVRRLMGQTRVPDGIVVVGAGVDDVEGLEDLVPRLRVMTAPKGLCRQRNAGLDAVAGECDAVVFIDDDFVPANDFLENAEALLAANDQIVGLTGQLVADGAQTGSLTFEEAVRRLDVEYQRPQRVTARTVWLYGCNMVVRLDAECDLRFDEALPLYGWQEDVDFSSRLGRRGEMYRSHLLTGIHLGVRGGRTSGRRLGYSQVANVIYLRRKGTIRLLHGWRIMVCNVAINLLMSIRPEPDIDRRGRLAGNLRAFIDLIQGRLDPLKVLSL